MIDPSVHATEQPWFADDHRPALLELMRALAARRYDFVTATPATHTRVVRRPHRQVARSMRDVLGWSLPFHRDVLDAEVFAILNAAGAVTRCEDGMFRPLIRVSRVEGVLFLHSAYPTDAHDSVFLGPDSYRFAQLIEARMLTGARRIVDYGAGAGVGGIIAARAAPGAHLTLADVNPKALFLASINAEHAGVDHATVNVSAPREIEGPFDVMVTHPPFMIDSERRAYRDGGDLYGAQLSLDWVLQGAALLGRGGRLILHTGVSIVDGRDVLLEALRERLPAEGFTMDYRELDPDIFSEDLEEPAYADVERIAAVALVLSKSE